MEAAIRLIEGGEIQAKKIIKEITDIIGKEPQATLEYAVVADPENLAPLTKIQGTALIAVGARIGHTSLNDSLLVEKAAR